MTFPVSESRSSLFAGGMRRSAKDTDLWIMINFRRAVPWISRGSFREYSWFQIFSVSLSPNESHESIVTCCVVNVKRYY